jgi:hypothetical protein
MMTMKWLTGILLVITSCSSYKYKRVYKEDAAIEHRYKILSKLFIINKLLWNLASSPTPWINSRWRLIKLISSKTLLANKIISVTSSKESSRFLLVKPFYTGDRSALFPPRGGQKKAAVNRKPYQKSLPSRPIWICRKNCKNKPEIFWVKKNKNSF